MSDKKINYEEAEKIIDNMYQTKMSEGENKTEEGTVIDLSENIEFTDLETASVRAIREVNSLKRKFQWKPISEYSKDKYDWVLVKYFDGDYECVPCVAEQRNGKWYDRNAEEIIFEVRYFFDMQQLDNE